MRLRLGFLGLFIVGVIFAESQLFFMPYDQNDAIRALKSTLSKAQDKIDFSALMASF